MPAMGVPPPPPGPMPVGGTLTGQRVMITDLVARADLNGGLGTCISFDGARYTVVMDDANGGGQVALKPANLVHVPPPPPKYNASL